MFQTTNQKTWVSRCSLQSLGTAGGNAAFGHRQGHLWMIFLRHETGDLASAVLPCWKKWNWYWKWQICSMARSDCQSVPKRLGSRFEVLEKSLRHVLLQQNGTSTSEVNFDFLSPGTSADISLSLYRSVMTPYCRCWFILMQTPLHDWYTAKRLTVLYFLCSQHCIYVNIHNIYKSIYNVSCMYIYIYIYTQYAVYMQYMIDYMHICGPKKVSSHILNQGFPREWRFLWGRGHTSYRAPCLHSQQWVLPGMSAEMNAILFIGLSQVTIGLTSKFWFHSIWYLSMHTIVLDT